LWLGWAACGKAGEKTFRTVVIVLLGVTGVQLVWQALRGMAG